MILLATVKVTPLELQRLRYFAACWGSRRTRNRFWDQTTIRNFTNICTLGGFGLFCSSMDWFLSWKATALFAETSPNRRSALCCSDFWCATLHQQCLGTGKTTVEPLCRIAMAVELPMGCIPLKMPGGRERFSAKIDFCPWNDNVIFAASARKSGHWFEKRSITAHLLDWKALVIRYSNGYRKSLLSRNHGRWGVLLCRRPRPMKAKADCRREWTRAILTLWIHWWCLSGVEGPLGVGIAHSTWQQGRHRGSSRCRPLFWGYLDFGRVFLDDGGCVRTALTSSTSTFNYLSG